MKYRNDIDGLRAVAVISVILFHLGYLANGYLGVDVFFVISGFLITSIIFHESQNGKFSVKKFYERRLRRIIPLLLVISIIALALGIYFMLPDDLENLSQSVVASNLSTNNILMLITSADYWAVKNDYKPLMHTWSLGIEEQFYLIYPILFMIFTGERIKYIKPVLLFLTLVSISLWFFSDNESKKFYLIQFRFFELAIGGLAAIQFQGQKERNVYHKTLLYLSLILLIALLGIPVGSNDLKVFLTTVLTACILVLGKHHVDHDKFYSACFTNRLMVYIGQISFSLYMWHHVVFAFARYAFVDEITVIYAIILSILTLGLSILTFQFIEKIFRNRQLISTRYVLVTLSILFVISTAPALYLYSIGGIYKDFPSLSLYKRDNEKREVNFFSVRENVHGHYNEAVRSLDKDFSDTQKPKILVIGNSFGRDVVNILLESSVANHVEIRYFDIKRAFEDKQSLRLQSADYILIGVNGFLGRSWVKDFETFQETSLTRVKLIVVGLKDFGYSNGIHYSRMADIQDFSTYRSPMKEGRLETNAQLKLEWGNQYIDLINIVRDADGNVLIFTPEGKFISQDTNHLTKDGAIFFANRLNATLQNLLTH